MASNATLVKFGYPETLLREFAHWVLLVRPQQVTLGALVLVAKEPVTAFSDLSAEAFAELKQVTAVIEGGLKALFRYDRINWLMLMMVDPDVHFHILPRYGQARVFDGVTFEDAGWPAVPQLGAVNEVPGAVFLKLTAQLRQQLGG